MSDLRNYQKECVSIIERALFEKPNVLVWAPTAAGKTHIFIHLITKWLTPDRRFVILVNRNELVTQTVNKLSKLSDKVTAYSAGYGQKDKSGQIIVASIQSVSKQTIENVAGIIIDETHNFASASGRYAQFIEAHGKAKVIGFTATPWSANKPIWGDGKFYDRIDYQITLKELIEKGYIVRPNFKCTPHQIDTSGMKIRLGEYAQEDVNRVTLDPVKVSKQVVDAIPRLVGRNKVLWVCASIEHAMLVYKYLNKIGEKAQTIHSKLPKPFAEYNKEQFEKKDARHMVSVMMATEGYDYPAIDAVSFMRPTKSANLFTQVVGRALRLYPGKEDALILDYGRVLENCGPLGSPNCIRYDSKKDNESVKYDTWVCKNCLTANELTDSQCLDCGYEKEVIHRDVTKNTTTVAASRPSFDIVIGRDNVGVFDVEHVHVSGYISRKGNKSIKLRWVLDHGEPHVEYITERMWNFKAEHVLKCTDIHYTSTFFNAFDVLSKKPVSTRKISKIKLTTNNKGFYVVKIKAYREPDRGEDSRIFESDIPF